jgi:y4mF family transcriptional regulator
MLTDDTDPQEAAITQELEALARAVALARQYATNMPDLAKAIRTATKAIEAVDPQAVSAAARTIRDTLPTMIKLSPATQSAIDRLGTAGTVTLPKLVGENEIAPVAASPDDRPGRRPVGDTVSQTPIMTSTDLGGLVKQARERRNLSQQTFADLAGVGRRFVSELENGKPTLEFDKVAKVARAAGLSLFAVPR